MLGPRPWDKDSIVSLMIALCFSISIGALLSMVVQKFNLGLTPPERQFASMIIMALAFQVFAFVWIAIHLRARQLTWKEAFGIGTQGYVKPIAIGMVAGVLILLPSLLLHKISMVVLEHFTVPAEQQEVVQRLRTGVSPLQQWFFFVLAAFIAPVIEELLFRGILYPALKNGGYKKFAVIGTSLLFASIHGNLMSLVPLAFIGIALIYLYETYDDLLVPMAAHGAFNLLNFLAIMYEAQINNWLKQYQ